MLIWLQTPVLTHFIVGDRFPDVPEVFRDGFWSQKVERKVGTTNSTVKTGLNAKFDQKAAKVSF